jgi:hypothetical protein
VLLTVGTGAEDGLAYPLNSMRIICVKADSTRDVMDAGFDLKNAFSDSWRYLMKSRHGRRVASLPHQGASVRHCFDDDRREGSGGYHCHCAARGLGRLHGGSADDFDVGRRNAGRTETLRGQDRSSTRADV